jgi:hypothetical protein
MNLLTRKTIIAVSLTIAMITAGLGASLVQASGTTTSQNDGEVLVTNQDGVMYLTTTTAGTPSATTYRTWNTGIFNWEVEIPEGFATDVSTALNAVLSFVMVIAALLVFFYLIWGGLQWISSGGDKTKVEAARQKIIAAVVGLIILASSYAVLLLSLNFLGFSDLNDVFRSTKTLSDPAPTTVPAPTPPLPSVTPSPTPLPTPEPTPTPTPEPTRRPWSLFN